jgi:ribokinase
MAAKKPIVVVGSINIDLVAVTPHIPAVGETVIGTSFQVHPGGKGANQAVAVARLGYPVELIGRLGKDVFGTQLRLHLQSENVGLSGVAESEGSSGVAVIFVSSEGENSIVVTPGANSKVGPEDIEHNIDLIRSAGVVLAQLEIPLETVECLAGLCARERLPLILDPAPAATLPASLLRQIDWFTPNETEAAFYANADEGDGAQLDPIATSNKLSSSGVKGVVLKLGSRGVYIAEGAGAGKLVPGFNVKAIDTTAAGDAFNGGFATGLMLGKTPIDSARFANAVAGISVTRMGAQPSMATMSEVEQLLRTTNQMIAPPLERTQ